MANRPARPAGKTLPQMVEHGLALACEGNVEEARELMLAAFESLAGRNRELELLVEKLRRASVGKRSEAIDPKQMALLFEQMCSGQDGREPEAMVDPELEARVDEQLDREIEQAGEAGGGEKKKRDKRERDVERKVRRRELAEGERECEGCGRVKSEIGVDVRRTLEYVPGHFVELEDHLAKYACGNCRDGVQTAPEFEPKVIERSPAGASLLAHIIVSKYVDHSPLNRLASVYARSGFDISVSTLADWVGAAADQLEPLVDALIKLVRASFLVRTDATGIKVLDPSKPENIVKGAMWCYVGDDKLIVYRYTPAGEGADGPWTFLAGRTGYVQADASNMFDRIFNGKVAWATEVGCWGHARRGWFDLKDVDSRVAYPLKIVARLYRIEHLADARGLDPPERARLRQERSQPELDKLKRWILRTQRDEPPKSALSRANAYVLNQWQALGRFVEDGRLALDNNLTEQQMRAIAMGRRNYLFCGSHRAAKRAAVLYSLVRTCALHGVEPLPYLTDVLRKLAAGWPQKRIGELLPGAWTNAAALAVQA